MKTIVVSGGTEGTGRAVARHHQGRGDTVIVNVSGPGVPEPEIHWNDIGQARGAAERLADLTHNLLRRHS